MTNLHALPPSVCPGCVARIELDAEAMPAGQAGELLSYCQHRRVACIVKVTDRSITSWRTLGPVDESTAAEYLTRHRLTVQAWDRGRADAEVEALKIAAAMN